MESPRTRNIGETYKARNKRNYSNDDTAKKSKRQIVTDLKNDKHLNIEQLIRKKVKNTVLKTIKFTTSENDRNMLCLDLIIKKEVNRFLNRDNEPFSVDGLNKVVERVTVMMKKYDRRRALKSKSNEKTKSIDNTSDE